MKILRALTTIFGVLTGWFGLPGILIALSLLFFNSSLEIPEVLLKIMICSFIMVFVFGGITLSLSVAGAEYKKREFK